MGDLDSDDLEDDLADVSYDKELPTATGELEFMDFEAGRREDILSDPDESKDILEAENFDIRLKDGARGSARARLEKVKEDRALRSIIFDDLYPETD